MAVQYAVFTEWFDSEYKESAYRTFCSVHPTLDKAIQTYHALRQYAIICEIPLDGPMPERWALYDVLEDGHVLRYYRYTNRFTRPLAFTVVETIPRQEIDRHIYAYEGRLAVELDHLFEIDHTFTYPVQPGDWSRPWLHKGPTGPYDEWHMYHPPVTTQDGNVYRQNSNCHFEITLSNTLRETCASCGCVCQLPESSDSESEQE